MDGERTPPTPEETRRRQRARSIAIGIALAGLVVLFYLVTVIRFNPSLAERPL